MKSTGITRRLDDLGRIVIPREIRRTLRLHEDDSMELCLTDEGDLLLRKHSNGMAVERELRAGINTLKEQFPAMDFAAFDKDSAPITEGWRNCKAAQLVKATSETKHEQTGVSEDACALTAIPIVVDGVTWAVLLVAGNRCVSASKFEAAEEAVRILCKYMERVFAL